MDHRVHGILQVRLLEWGAYSFSRGSSQPGDQTQVFHIAGRFFASLATREVHFFTSWATGEVTILLGAQQIWQSVLPEAKSLGFLDQSSLDEKTQPLILFLGTALETAVVPHLFGIFPQIPLWELLMEASVLHLLEVNL